VGVNRVMIDEVAASMVAGLVCDYSWPSVGLLR